jgi:hypothetical protein
MRLHNWRIAFAREGRDPRNRTGRPRIGRVFGSAPNADAQATSLFSYDTRPTVEPPEQAMSLGTILLIVLILILIGALPAWPHSRSWGYLPSGGLGLVVLVVLILLVLGKL